MFFFSRALWTLAYVLHTIICPPNENTWMDARHASRTVNAYFIISMCAHYCAIHQIHNGWPFCALLQVSVQHCWLLGMQMPRTCNEDSKCASNEELERDIPAGMYFARNYLFNSMCAHHHAEPICFNVSTYFSRPDNALRFLN